MIQFYSPFKFSIVVAYMLQNVEYRPALYLKWLLRIRNPSSVMYRRTLQKTPAANAFRQFVCSGMLVQYAIGSLIAVRAYSQTSTALACLAILITLLTPATWAILVTLPLVVARVLVSLPKERRLIAASKTIFANHKAVKIAVAGSYGKTSMKEMLGTILSQYKNVAITPANKNVASSHALFARSLTGSEEVLVVEFGEGKPGDVEQFSITFNQDIVVITGIAPAHLDAYSSVVDAANDIFSATSFVDEESVYVNVESTQALSYLKPGFVGYSRKGLKDLMVSKIVCGLEGTSFVAATSKKSYNIHTTLVGRQTIGPLCAAIAISERLGLTVDQIEAGCALVKPYEHRMEPRQLSNGAWIIDDTYNGNIEGIEAGLALLKELSAKRKIYVSPGLVDQGSETKTVHVKMGNLIAGCSPDLVILMKNSAAQYIQEGMTEGGYSGELRIEEDPLDFYTHIEQFVAEGNILLMQNDWPDNYL